MPVNTLLFDLDDTLLGNRIESFLPVYIQKLAERMQNIVPPQMLVNELIAGTQAMLTNHDPARTLEEAFSAHFYAAIGQSPHALLPQLNSFYATDFGALQYLTQPIAVAPEIMRWAKKNRLNVAVATNALFPATAILQRLAWAGVSVNDVPYSLVTSFEFMHFAKPRPEFYAEVLAWIDCRADEVLMVGNDWFQDIIPADTLGINTFWVAPLGAKPPANSAHPFAIGELQHFFDWISQPNALSTLPVRQPEPGAVRAHQAAQLAVMLHVARNVTEAEWQRRPAHDSAGWSLTEIMCHLRDVEQEVNLPRIRRILVEDNPFISAVNSDQWAHERDYQSQSGTEALMAFAAARKETLAIFDSLSPEQWQRTARHTIFGPTALHELAAFTIEHDRLHLRQMRELIAETLPLPNHQ